MGRQIHRDDEDGWVALFDGFTTSAFRWEAQQHYESPEESAALARFRAGLDPGLDLSWEVDTTRAYLTQGKRLARVRLVLEPVSDYVRMALHYLPVLAEAGEDIRVLASPGYWPRGLPQHDFWIFDDEDVWTMAYDDHGRFLLAEQVEESMLTGAHRAWRDEALRQAMPLSHYLAAARRKAS